MRTGISFAAVCAATMFAYAEAESGTVECRGFGRVEFRCRDGGFAVSGILWGQTPENAHRLGFRAKKADCDVINPAEGRINLR